MTSGIISIRPFRPENQVAIQELINSGLGEHWGHTDPHKNPDLFDIAASYKHDTFLVAWQDEEIIGTGALVRRSHITAEIVRMTVSSAHRRLGVGTHILNELVSIAREAGYQEVILETTETWNDVIAFYLAYGFRITHYTNGDVYFTLHLTDRSKPLRSEP